MWSMVLQSGCELSIGVRRGPTKLSSVSKRVACGASLRSYYHATTNPHEVLGIHERANKKEIKAAYIRLSKLYHPDCNRTSNKDSAANFKQISDAYQKLTALPELPGRERVYEWSGSQSAPPFPPESVRYSERTITDSILSRRRQRSSFVDSLIKKMMQNKSTQSETQHKWKVTKPSWRIGQVCYLELYENVEKFCFKKNSNFGIWMNKFCVTSFRPLYANLILLGKKIIKTYRQKLVKEEASLLRNIQFTQRILWKYSLSPS